MRLFLGSAQRPAARRHRLAGAAAACLCATVAATALPGAPPASAAPAGLIARAGPQPPHSAAPGPGAGQASSGSGSSRSGGSSAGSGGSGAGGSGSGSSRSGSNGSGPNGPPGSAGTQTATVGGARLAQATGSYAKGMALINAEAHHLQAYDTVAVRPNGLDAPGQHVSAYDEALFARQALAVPAFMHDEALRRFRFQLRPHGTRHHPR